jgi:hypothetical protein
MIVFSENRMKHTNTLCVQDAEFNLKQMVHIVTSVLQRVRVTCL